MLKIDITTENEYIANNVYILIFLDQQIILHIST